MGGLVVVFYYDIDGSEYLCGYKSGLVEFSFWVDALLLLDFLSVIGVSVGGRGGMPLASFNGGGGLVGGLVSLRETVDAEGFSLGYVLDDVILPQYRGMTFRLDRGMDIVIDGAGLGSWDKLVGVIAACKDAGIKFIWDDSEDDLNDMFYGVLYSYYYSNDVMIEFEVIVEVFPCSRVAFHRLLLDVLVGRHDISKVWLVWFKGFLNMWGMAGVKGWDAFYELLGGELW